MYRTGVLDLIDCLESEKLAKRQRDSKGETQRVEVILLRDIYTDKGSLHL